MSDKRLDELVRQLAGLPRTDLEQTRLDEARAKAREAEAEAMLAEAQLGAYTPSADVPVDQADITVRRRGRQPWTRSLFKERYDEAVALAGGNTTDAAVAGHFRGLNAAGDRGVTPEYLAKKRQQCANGSMPE